MPKLVPMVHASDVEKTANWYTSSQRKIGCFVPNHGHLRRYGCDGREQTCKHGADQQNPVCGSAAKMPAGD